MKFRDRLEAFLALQAKNESERELNAVLLRLNDEGRVECKWADTGELLVRRKPGLRPRAIQAGESKHDHR